MTSYPKTIIHGDNCNLDSVQLLSGQRLSIADGVKSDIKELTIGDGCELHIDGGELIVGRLSAGTDFKITGTGSITVLEMMTCGVGSDIDLSSISLTLMGATVEIGDGSTLHLYMYPVIGGTIRSNARMLLEAGCKNIFKGTTLEGQIMAHETYPEWFADGEQADWAPHINRALELSEDGTTYLQGKIYDIASTIYVPCRGRLLGNPSQKYQIGDTIYYGTRLQPSGNAFDASCIIAVNVNSSILKETNKQNISKAEDLAIREFTTPGAEVGYIRIENSNNSRFYTGILIACNGYVHDVVFQQLSRSILWTRNYGDQKKVTRCVVNDILRDTSLTDPESVYAIDFNNLGDALIFEGNAIHGSNREKEAEQPDTYIFSGKGLRLNCCMGGIVTANVINADVYILNCKSVDFSNNHMEYGAQLYVRDSALNVSGNYFEKGLRASVVVESGENANAAVVNFSGNEYLYLSNASRTKIAKEESTGHMIYRRATPDEICDYDMLLKSTGNDMSAIVNISNDLRYWGSVGGALRMYPVGISVYQQLGTGNPELIESFKWRSHLLSRSSSLMFCPSLKVSYPVMTVTNLGSPEISIWGVNNNITWFGTSGTVKYYFQIVWDHKSSIVTPYKEANYRTEGSFSPVKGSSGLLINVNGAAAGCGNQLMIRIFRELTYKGSSGQQKEYSYVDIPIVGSRIIYDDGVTLASYHWHKINSLSEAKLSGKVNASSITYVGDQLIV